MRFEEEVEATALCLIDPGDRDLMAVLIVPCTLALMLPVDVDGAEPLRDDAHERIGPAFPPRADHRLVGGGVLKASDGQRSLMSFGIAWSIPAGEYPQAFGSEAKRVIKRFHFARHHGRQSSVEERVAAS